MKNKSVTYLLVGVVVLVWGLVVYRLFIGMSDDEGAFTVPNHAQQHGKSEKSEVADTFELILDYRDPFLGKVSSLSFSGSSEDAVRTIRRKVEPKVVAPPPPPMDWSFVAYLGAIRNKQLNKEVGMFRLHGTEVMMGANEKRADVSVLKVTRDSAVIQYQGIKKVLTKSF